ncbi:Molybdopterin molybdenumtransferase [Poriferisphaera corsica]|uniref:Molybdopterin molybdenumtransferase n=1 Tax=Poriferisphaera corsica TaxID=2528020 RepID=A0A517YZ54_9BACT|nr:molybdopterin molybdotransferase MoeA [Poriferisphaera corsica]QDU35511.1 Molybdopterin molybdenumtransferase [Poriferisphaera corsica]
MNTTPSGKSLLSYDWVISLIQQTLSARPTQTTSLCTSLHRILREPIHADRDLPPFNRATMDGFAIHSADYKPNHPYTVLTDLPAGEMPSKHINLSSGVISIATGAAVPATYDAVIPIESATVHHDSVQFHTESITPFQNIHQRAADATSGQQIIPPNIQLSPHHLAIAASVGHASLRTAKQPRISIFTTGNEVQSPDTETAVLQPMHIRNANLPMLASLISTQACHLSHQEHLPDHTEVMTEAILKASHTSDLIITAGSISVGKHDHIAQILEKLGYNPVFQGLAVQPGKPTALFHNTDPHAHPPVLCLPGNPVSALAAFHLIAIPILNHLQSNPSPLPWQRVWSTESITPNPKREMFRAVKFIGDTRDQIQLIPWHTSGDIVHTALADGIIRVPLQQQSIPPGSPLPFLPIA